MSQTTPHYVLYSTMMEGVVPRWRFELRTADGASKLVAEDCEPAIQGERLELLAVVRGLEALEQPSRVTLLTPSSYVRQGLRYGLADWRQNGWRWEFFGQMVPVKNGDLWRRIDAAMRYHQVECRVWRRDAGHASHAAPAAPSIPSNRRPEVISSATLPESSAAPTERPYAGRVFSWFRRLTFIFKNLARRWSGDRVTLVPSA